jgi:predicted transcriptional regulator
MTSEWKSRAKKSKILLKNLAKEAKLAPQHLTKIISGECKNPRLKTLNAVEMALRDAEKKAGVR